MFLIMIGRNEEIIGYNEIRLSDLSPDLQTQVLIISTSMAQTWQSHVLSCICGGPPFLPL